MLRGRLNATSLEAGDGYEAWFGQWVASILHLLPMLLPPDDDANGRPHASPIFGLDDVGSVVPFDEATAPPLPRHPMPGAELLEGLLTREDAATSDAPAAVAAYAEWAVAAASAAAAATRQRRAQGSEVSLPNEKVFEFSHDEFERSATAAEVKAALYTYAVRAGQPESADMQLDGTWKVSSVTRDPDDGEAFFTDVR